MHEGGLTRLGGLRSSWLWTAASGWQAVFDLRVGRV